MTAAKLVLISPLDCSNRFGYADFSTSKDLKAALNLNGSEVDGREIRINEAEKRTPNSNSGGRNFNSPRGGGTPRGGGREQSEPNSTLIVLSLSYDSTSESLGEAFEGCVDARVITDRETGQSRG